MVRLVPTADPEILLFAPADQLAQPTEQAKGKSVDPSKKKPATKKPSRKAAHPCKDRQSQFSLQQEIQSGSGFPSFFQPELLHGEFKSLPNHRGVMTTLDSDVRGEGQSATSQQASCSGSPKMRDHLGIPFSKLSLNTFLPTTLDSCLTHCAHGEMLHLLLSFH